MGTSFPPTQHSPHLPQLTSYYITAQLCPDCQTQQLSTHCRHCLPWVTSPVTDWSPVLECKTPTELVPRQSLPSGPACRTNQDSVSRHHPLHPTNQNTGQRSSWVSWLSRSEFYIQEYYHNKHNLPSPHNSRLNGCLPQSYWWNINISIPPTCLPTTSNTGNALMRINNTGWVHWAGEGRGGGLLYYQHPNSLHTITVLTAHCEICLFGVFALTGQTFPCKYLDKNTSFHMIQRLLNWQ